MTTTESFDNLIERQDAVLDLLDDLLDQLQAEIEWFEAFDAKERAEEAACYRS